jgi:hypothetical protein
MPLSTIFRLTRWAVLWFIVSTGFAMLVYPGGTRRNPSAGGYLFFRNFLSDLGTTVTWGGHPNPIGAPVFIIAEVLTALAIIACFVGLVRLLSSSQDSRSWARAAGTAGIVAAAGFISAALIPVDLNARIHRQAVQLAFRAILLSSLLFTVAAARDIRFPRRASGVWLLLTLLLMGYIAILEWGPRLRTDHGLLVQVTAQKFIVIAVLLGLAYQSYEAERVSALVPPPLLSNDVELGGVGDGHHRHDTGLDRIGNDEIGRGGDAARHVQ